MENNTTEVKKRGRPKKYTNTSTLEQTTPTSTQEGRPRGRPVKFKSLEEQRANKRKYYQDNREVIHERMNEYYEKHKARIREQYNKRQAHFKFLQEFYDKYKDKVETLN